jgi:Lsr2
MARKVEVILEDDLSGGPAEATVQFGLDGHSWEIDLNSVNAEALRASLVEYIAAGRKAGGPSVKAQSQRTDKAVTKAIREWAEANNWECKSRGRIPHEIVEAYNAAA